MPEISNDLFSSEFMKKVLYGKEAGWQDSSMKPFPIKPKIGVSSCLLGQLVRYNGEHKYNQTVIDLFGLDDQFEAVPVCPEVEMGMGVPREKVQIVEGDETHRMAGVESGKDWTDAMTDFSSKKLEELNDLCGFIFKTRSPSCGTQAVPVHPATGETTAGLFARAFMKHFPDMPVIDEEQLQDEQARENFIARARLCLEEM